MDYIKQPYERKIWDDVPDPSKYEGDLDSLPRFDAANMNRLEDGIEDALIGLETKAPTGHGLGGTVGKTKYASFLNTMLKGCGFYEMGTSNGSPLTTDEWLAMLQLSRGITEGEQTGTQLAFYDFDPNNPRMWLRTILKGVEGDWAEMIHTGNIAKNNITRVETKTYTGTGLVGLDNATKITFSRIPKFFTISGFADDESEQATLVVPWGISGIGTQVYDPRSTSRSQTANLAFNYSGATVTFHHSHIPYFNISTQKYTVIGIS